MIAATSCAEFRIIPSRWHDILVSFAHLSTLFFLLLMPLAPWYRGALIAALFVCLFVNRIRYQRVSRCHLQPGEDQWIVNFPGFAAFQAACEPVYRSRWLLLLRVEAERRCWFVPVFPDSVKPGEFRRLHMLLH